MALNLIGIVVLVVILLIVYFLLTVMIREITELYKVEQHTMLNASKISGVIVGLMLIQYLMSKWAIISGIVLAVMVISLFYIIQREYKTELKKTVLIGFSIIIGFGILAAALAGLIIWLR
ncbi:hypothetical protein H6503_05555 [Candidatus Woesearchaeota archaeon]|nr:hypothetical protein [Candidatus Woesearchaeota archaeon]